MGYPLKLIVFQVTAIAVALFLLLALTKCEVSTKDPFPGLAATYLPTEAPDPYLALEEAGQVMDTLYSERYAIDVPLAREIRRAATSHAIPLSIAFALVRVESAFDPLAVSWAGAIGLTQVMPPTGEAHCGMSPSDLYLVAPNLACGFSYLAMLRERGLSWEAALASYNAGPARYLRSPQTGEYSGLAYARLVLGWAEYHPHRAAPINSDLVSLSNQQ